MFTNLKSVIVNHAKQIEGMKIDLAEAREKLRKNNQYAAAFKDSEYAIAKEKYDADRLEQIAKSKEEMNSVFAEIYEKLEDSITAEIGQETISELQMLSNMKVSEFELNAYAKKYAGKYKALRLLNKVAENSGIPFTYVTDDDIVNDLNSLKAKVIRFFNAYDGIMTDDYISRYILMNSDGSISKEEENLFFLIESEFNDFMNPFVGVKSYINLNGASNAR